MTQDEIIEMAIQGHSSFRDAIRWAIVAERQACAKVVENKIKEIRLYSNEAHHVDCLTAIRARGEQA